MLQQVMRAREKARDAAKERRKYLRSVKMAREEWRRETEGRSYSPGRF